MIEKTKSTTAEDEFSHKLRSLHRDRRHKTISTRGSRPPRKALTTTQRREILGKTGGRCHICGGHIVGNSWNADHILAHSAGGAHATDNYLPAHGLCNNYRWHYSPEEFQYILKIGVWMRTHMEKRTLLGLMATKMFVAYERVRESRRSLSKKNSRK